MFGAVAELTIIDGKPAEFEAVAKELEAAVAVDAVTCAKVEAAETTLPFNRSL